MRRSIWQTKYTSEKCLDKKFDATVSDMEDVQDQLAKWLKKTVTKTRQVMTLKDSKDAKVRSANVNIKTDWKWNSFVWVFRFYSEFLFFTHMKSQIESVMLHISIIQIEWYIDVYYCSCFRRYITVHVFRKIYNKYLLNAC